MSHFAKVQNNYVIDVIVAEQDFIDSLPQEEGIEWIQTSVNTYSGVHRLGGTPLRKNFAAKGYTYDRQRDAFLPPRPSSSFILDEATGQWYPPIPMPIDGKMYYWDLEQDQWIEFTYPTGAPE